MNVAARIWTFSDGGVWDFSERTRVLGILNVTPDSFSDGGLYFDPDKAVTRGLEMAAEGADGIDVGGESTRPGSLPVPEEEQIRRIVPVIRALRRALAERADAGERSDFAGSGAPSPVTHEKGWRRTSERSPSGGSPPSADAAGIPTGADGVGAMRARGSVGLVRISVDTSRAAVAAAAIEAGADVVNDVTALAGDPEMGPLLAGTGAGTILMHMRGAPRTMQEDPRYADVVGEIASELRGAWDRARSAGVRDDRIVLDPGIGFGKTADHNLEILARLPALASLGRPLVVGVSRKSFLGKVTGLRVEERLEASLAAGAAAVLGGASLLRVHDVAATVRMVQVIDAIRLAGRAGRGNDGSRGAPPDEAGSEAPPLGAWAGEGPASADCER